MSLRYLYTGINCRHKEEPLTVVLVYSNNLPNHGLSDRLRAITSIYHWTKSNNIRFRLWFDDPCNLEDYLIPNKYNWKVCSEELDYNNAIPMSIYSYSIVFGEKWNSMCQKKSLEKIKKAGGLVHLYSNAFCYDEHFEDLYHELFKPSPQLIREINILKKQIGCAYISVSFRFTQLLGDLKDFFGKPLETDEKSELINKCLEALEIIHNKNENYKRILITSDSRTFLEQASKISYVYIVPGEVGHISHNASKGTIDKTFWDMYLIAGAKKAYMVRTDNMYNSGFAKRSAMIGNVPFEEYLIK